MNEMSREQQRNYISRVLAEKPIPVPVAHHKSHMVYRAIERGPPLWKAATNHTLYNTALNTTCIP